VDPFLGIEEMYEVWDRRIVWGSRRTAMLAFGKTERSGDPSEPAALDQGVVESYK
jgi:hypothetical protein